MPTSHNPQHSHWGPSRHQGLAGWLQQPPCFCALFPLPTPNPLYSLHSSRRDPLQQISHLIPLLRTLQWLPNSEKGSTVFTTLCELSPHPLPPLGPTTLPLRPSTAHTPVYPSSGQQAFSTTGFCICCSLLLMDSSDTSPSTQLPPTSSSGLRSSAALPSEAFLGPLY